MVYVGVDLHKRMSRIAVLTADSELSQQRLPNARAQVESFFAQLPTPAIGPFPRTRKRRRRSPPRA
jgi:hypothetical protein